MPMKLKLLAVGASAVSLWTIAPRTANAQALFATFAPPQVTPLRLGQRQEFLVVPGVTYSFAVDIAGTDQYVVVSLTPPGSAMKFVAPDGAEVPMLLPL